MVVNAGPGPSDQTQLARESTNDLEVAFPDSVPGRTVVEVCESVLGLGSSNRTQQRRTLELIAHIGCQPITILVDSGLTGNYIDA